MIVESNQIFNLMDTNGRRSDVLNALKIYLEILEELKEVYPTESWGTYPDSLSQFLFYEKALEKSKDVFKIHSNYDNFISELGDDYQTFIDRDGQWIENNIAKFAKVLDEAIEKRARHYTSNLVKMGFTDSNRSITEAGYSYLRGSVIRDDLEEILPLDNVNIVLLRQLSKLKIFSSSREGKRQYYSPFILALVLLLDEKTIEEHTFEIIVQGLSPYSSDEVKEAIRSNSIGVDELEASIRDLDISIPDELIGKIDIECLSNVQDEIGGLIITGDITSTAEKNGFEKATKLIDDLSRNYVFTNENIAICPGNHDFKFSQKDLDVDEKPKAVSKLYTKAYSNFYKSVYNISPNEYYCCGKKILLSSGHVVEIVALNSLYLQQHQNFNGHGYLSEKQLNFVATEMGWNNKKARNVIRIVMMHHHYLPVCYTEAIDVKRASSVVYDADRLMNWMIKHDVKVLLHGHKHKSIVAQVTYPDTSFSNENNETQMKKISVIGMGGTGCKHTQNLFGTLGFDDNKLYIKFYQIYSDESSEDSEYQTIVLPLER